MQDGRLWDKGAVFADVAERKTNQNRLRETSRKYQDGGNRI